MSEQHLCDICQNVLARQYYNISILKKVIKNSKHYEESERERYEQPQFSNEPLEIKEVCCECYRVFERLLNVRLAEIEKLKKELKRMGE